MTSPDLMQCSLCQGILPANKDEVFLGHMRDQHRAYCDLDFMFAVFCLSKEDKAITLEFINDQLEQKRQEFEPRLLDDKESTKPPETEMKSEEKFPLNDLSEYERIREENIKERLQMWEDLEMNTAVDEVKSKRSLKMRDKKKPLEEQDSKAVTRSHHKFEVKLKLPIPSNISISSVQGITAPESQKGESDETENLSDNKALTAKRLDEKIISIKRKLQEISVSDKDKTVEAKHGTQTKKPKNVWKLPGFCKDCNKDVKQLKFHRYNSHGTVSTCELCGKNFNSSTLLARHKRRFHRPYSPCPDCGKLVKKLKQHQMTQHTDNDDKKYKCLTCGKGFAVKFALVEHERIHGEKTFPCRVSNGLCGIASTTPGNIIKHEAKCKYWERPGDYAKGIKTEERKNIKCEVEFKEGKLELDV